MFRLPLLLFLLLSNAVTTSAQPITRQKKTTKITERRKKLTISNKEALEIANIHGSGKRNKRRNLREGRGTFYAMTVFRGVSVLGGAEFDDPNTYQSKALDYVLNVRNMQEVTHEFRTYYALASIFYASNGTHNKYTLDSPFFEGRELTGWFDTENWLHPTEHFCSWWGVQCNNGGRVKELQLSANNMFGVFAPEVQHLYDLEVLELFNNFFLLTEGDEGNSWIGRMSNLQKFFVGTTSFEYDGIPPYFNGLQKLETIDISNSFFTDGPIRDSSFRNTPRLNYIDMAENVYTTVIPNSISVMPSLNYFYLDNVYFDNVDQDLMFLTTMPSLQEAWMDFTFFVGGLPPELGNINTLQSLSLTYCGLDGPIPPELGSIPNLDRIWLYQNSLTGEIPAELGNLNRVQVLFVEGNDLVGTMPASLCNKRPPNGILNFLGADCEDSQVTCGCCTCCGEIECNDFAI